MNIRIISAGAGSGKTYRLTAELVKLLAQGLSPAGIIATTFTKKAAAELQERVRIKLLQQGMHHQAESLTNALIGTVHGLGVKLLQRFAYEAGVSPNVSIMADEDQQLMFNQSLAVVLNQERVQLMEDLCDRLGFHKRGHYDWRKDVKQLADIARTNNFSKEILKKSKEQSYQSFLLFLDPVIERPDEEWSRQLKEQLENTIQKLISNQDKTKKTADLVRALKQLKDEYQLRGHLQWHQWLKLAKLNPGVKSKDDYYPFKEFANTHLGHAAFHQDIQQFIYQVFELALASIDEFNAYKKNRGLIDYTDMEVMVNDILDHPKVKTILEQELQLLMVDEFQDTSPLQLEIFIKLSKLAGQSIWVGDPKQSIYGFRGAEPALMNAVIQKLGGVRPEDIQTYSWRSREDIVYAVNSIFTKSFKKIPKEQVALSPKRCKVAVKESINKENEPNDVKEAIVHWDFRFEGGKRSPKRPWFENCIAEALKSFLEGGVKILPKGETTYRMAKPGDVAVLCRTNSECLLVAESLNRVGFKTAIAQNGLLETAEIKLLLACLKYILNRYDSLSVAEILTLASEKDLEAIVASRLSFLKDDKSYYKGWAIEDPYIQLLNTMRGAASQMTSREVLDWVIAELGVRRMVVQWGNVNQRLENIEAIRKLANQYEDNCTRLHVSASLGGMLLWLDQLASDERDVQGFSQDQHAVNIITYHRSKGLEWPIVVCHSLEGKLKSKVFGFSLINDQAIIDLENVLGNRWLRYWINPYGDRVVVNSQLDLRIKESTAFEAVTEEALSEDARLLYVGLTRARDHLVIPSREIPTRWLNRIWHNGDEDMPTLNPDHYESPWSWNEKWINKKTDTFLFGTDFDQSTKREVPAQVFPPASGKINLATHHIDLRREANLIRDLEIKDAAPISYFPVQQLPFDVDPYQLSKALKSFFIADFALLDSSRRNELVERQIKGYQLGEFIHSQWFLKQSELFKTTIRKQFKPIAIHQKQSLNMTWQSRSFRTIVDFVVVSKQEVIFIQNSGTVGALKQWKRKSKELATWIYLVRIGLEEQFKGKNVKGYLHFVLGGTLLEVNPFVLQQQQNQNTIESVDYSTDS